MRPGLRVTKKRSLRSKEGGTDVKTNQQKYEPVRDSGDTTIWQMSIVDQYDRGMELQKVEIGTCGGLEGEESTGSGR
jgi:hypothetical protein